MLLCVSAVFNSLTCSASSVWLTGTKILLPSGLVSGLAVTGPPRLTFHTTLAGSPFVGDAVGPWDDDENGDSIDRPGAAKGGGGGGRVRVRSIHASCVMGGGQRIESQLAGTKRMLVHSPRMDSDVLPGLALLTCCLLAAPQVASGPASVFAFHHKAAGQQQGPS